MRAAFREATHKSRFSSQNWLTLATPSHCRGMSAVMQWTQDHDWAPSAGNRQQGESIMKDKNLNMPDHLTADVWSQHLHEIDLLNRAADENTARYLARFKEGTHRDEKLFKYKLRELQTAELTRIPFWITEK
jgi:hypothetical protein